MDKQNFDTTVNSLFSGMDHVLSSKTVVGEPQVIGDTIILPLVDISFGMGAGAFNKEKGSSAGGGIGGKMSPSAILVIQSLSISEIRMPLPKYLIWFQMP